MTEIEFLRSHCADHHRSGRDATTNTHGNIQTALLSHFTEKTKYGKRHLQPTDFSSPLPRFDFALKNICVTSRVLKFIATETSSSFNCREGNLNFDKQLIANCRGPENIHTYVLTRAQKSRHSIDIRSIFNLRQG